MADRLPAGYVTDREITGPIDRQKTAHVFDDMERFGLGVAGTPTTQDVLLFVAKKAGVITDVGAGLVTDGSSTSIACDVKKNGTTILSGTIALTHSTGDGVEVAGSISGGTVAYAAGDRITAVITVTSATGAAGPWIRTSRYEVGD